MSIKKRMFTVEKLVYLAMLTALVIVLQLAIAPLIGSLTGLSPALVLIPIVLGVAACGPLAGAWLGFVFSLIVMFDPTTMPFFDYNPIMTILLVFTKGMGSGMLAGLIFDLISKKNKYLAIVVAAISAPIINTGIFVVGSILFFRELTGIEIYTLFTSVNFGVEIAINAVFVPVIYHLLEVSRVFKKR